MNNPFQKITTADELIRHFHDGMTLMYGGFGGVGSPPTIIEAILQSGIKDLTLIGNDTGFPHIGIGQIVSQGRVRRITTSHIGSNPIAGQLMTDGKMDVEFCPQGILAERIRAGGMGIPAILSDIGMDNEIVTAGKQTCTIGKQEYLVEPALTAEISIIYAKKADSYGNLIYDKSARNTNPLCAMAGDITIAEVEEIVPLGSLHPDEIITPGVFVDYIIPSEGVNWKWAWE
ncbi:CoA transferase subunit A [Cytobacillus purgationiresistens]|uniref:Acetate CoA/acetoacetate CoA-transferase alpha subunit n=1 Tax=Cytobacillus purgationiresistens TaxID=863449 RepID=A0ABU0APL0_9BACI|nr:CoA transferase subunit A [Cytobacillus purgationiresistens]MDQ0271985.1 acetate CoA/acetoacetate CoA-transferase alpha subunit [Cytobacillus purgationiresistens]